MKHFIRLILILLFLTGEKTGYCQNAYQIALKIQENTEQIKSYTSKNTGLEYHNKNLLKLCDNCSKSDVQFKILNSLVLNQDTVFDINDLNNELAVFDSLNIAIEIKNETDKEIEKQKKVRGNKIDPNYTLPNEQVELIYKKFNESNFSTASDRNSIILQSLPGASLTSNLVAAGSQFLVERTKEEFSLFFINNLRNKLDSIDLLQKLFPHTYTLLHSISPTEIPTYGQVWKTAFQNDISALPVNLLNWVSNQEKGNLSQSNQDGLQLLNAIHQLQQGMSFEIILNSIANNSKSDSPLKLIAFIMNNLKTQDALQPWVSTTDINKLNTNGKYYFIRLLICQEKALFDNIKIKNEKNEQVALMKYIESELVRENFLKNIGAVLDIFNKISISIQELQLAEDKTKYYQQYTDLFISLFMETERLKWTGNHTGFLNSEFYKNTVPLFESIKQFTLLIESKNYGGALAEFMKVLKPINDSLFLKCKIDTSMSRKVYILYQLSENVLFYGSFMADILQSDSTEAVKDVIKKYAMPVGSYQVKRRSKFTVGINAYPGLIIGWEKNLSRSSNSLSSYKQGFNTGITAPIGFNFSWGLRNSSNTINANSYYTRFNYNEKDKKVSAFQSRNNSISLFISVIDIGAPFAYYFNQKDSVAGFPDQLKLEQILSPGVFCSWGIKNTPLALNFGAQITPQLRKIDQAGSPSFYANSLRFSVGLNMDIPVFSFYTRKTKYKR